MLSSRARTLVIRIVIPSDERSEESRDLLLLPTTHCFQVLHQPFKRRAIRIVLLPVAEVGDEVLAYLAGRVLSGIAVEALPIAQRIKSHQPDRKQHPLTFLHLTFASLGNLGPHPLTAHAVLGEDQQQLVMQANGLVDLLVQLAASLDVVGREPAAHALGLQVGMEPLGELPVTSRIADEAGVELDGPSHHRADVGDELVWHAAAAQEYL